MVWYDVPGAGTLNVKDWQYFNDQGLYVFDFIIAVIDNRFTETDVAVLKNCSRFEIPSFIVRSKANQHIRNMMEDDEDLSEAEAVQALVLQTRANIRQNLQQVELDPDQYVYIVSKDTLCTLVKSRFDPSLVPKGPIIDEPKLIHDLLKAAHDRRSLTGGRLKISLGGLNLDSLSLGRKGKEIGDAGPPRN